jgi:hypothetical protein
MSFGGRTDSPPASKKLANWAPTESDRQFVVDPLRQEFLGVDCPAGATFPGAVPEKAWFPGPLKFQFLFAFFFGAREDQPVLLRSRAICRLSRIFSEILQDRHRPPCDLADILMRNSSSGQNASYRQKNGIPVPWARISRGGCPLRGKLRIFSDATLIPSYACAQRRARPAAHQCR